MLNVRNLSKFYRDVKAVDHINFFVNKGEVAVLVGPNGAGKSTTIQSIMGILRFDGDVTIGEYDNKTFEAKRMISYVPEIPSMFPLLTVREHIEYIARAYRTPIDNNKIDQLLKRFDLYDKQDKLGDALSKGMMQKVSICCALIVDPQVLVLDEPMVGLDPKAIKELKMVIKECRAEGKTVLVSTHMMEMVDELWDRVILMKLGKVVADITREEAGESELEDLFFEITGDKDASIDLHEVGDTHE
ncbi:ABC transporter ATP-binding protein [Erysipelothrix larvae]|uniref:ABC transporter ATP-binding protein n=1 Tax=Erysipelothrix larvae TaxID=1514105 RepID=A0A0X8GYS7_9FIRM|nr:ABC transporter ATP-binding protein [Erysipelothrix larvae]AMC92916.1 ABC transporter ATP-binding protein [Erysipelothrix larvae]